mmetsp:Transcript_79194/g.132237  ORF Transcript_79194/g.132237 Transcript_79194/m.132237 type:complete len:194 (+) Transcript_79194:69-650(+)
MATNTSLLAAAANSLNSFLTAPAAAAITTAPPASLSPYPPVPTGKNSVPAGSLLAGPSNQAFYQGVNSQDMDESNGAQYTEEEWAQWRAEQPRLAHAARAQQPATGVPQQPEPRVAPQPPQQQASVAGSSTSCCSTWPRPWTCGYLCAACQVSYELSGGGAAPLTAHEPTQLSIATGLASEEVDYVFMDGPWL